VPVLQRLPAVLVGSRDREEAGVNRGQSIANGDSAYNGPQPVHQDQSVIDARAISTTFWELL
jgi:hypothetical protein